MLKNTKSAVCRWPAYKNHYYISTEPAAILCMFWYFG